MSSFTQTIRENHELKEELVLCLMELTNRDSEVCETDEEWTKKQDRGGLWYVKETTFQLFCAIEYQLRPSLMALEKPSPPSKAEIIKGVISDDDVQFYWLIASENFEIDSRATHEILLKKIVELFLTVRGFSCTAVWMEWHKQINKKKACNMQRACAERFMRELM